MEWKKSNASVIVDAITKDWLGAIGGVLAILGVIAAPITSGDTAFRSARLIVADFLDVETKKVCAVVYTLYSDVRSSYRSASL